MITVIVVTNNDDIAATKNAVTIMMVDPYEKTTPNGLPAADLPSKWVIPQCQRAPPGYASATAFPWTPGSGRCRRGTGCGVTKPTPNTKE